MKEINIGKAAALTSPDPLVLISTQKENGQLNLAPVSFFMYTSFNPAMIAFAMGKTANTGENFRKSGKAVISVPGKSLAEAVMVYGSSTGAKVDKLEKTPIPLKNVDGSDIQVPEDSKVVFVVSLEKTLETGDHYLYVCNVDKMYGDDTKEALFAWNGYAKVSPAEQK